MTAAPHIQRSNAEIGVLVRGVPEERFRHSGITLFEELTPVAMAAIDNFFVLVSSTSLAEVASLVKAATKQKHLRGLLIHHCSGAEWVPSILNRANIHSLARTFPHSDLSVFERILRAWSMSAQDALIADATIIDTTLFVKACNLDTIEVDINNIKYLRGATADALRDLQIGPNGSFLYWPSLDIHLDLDAIRTIVNPEFRQQKLAQRLRHNEQLGQAIRQFRKAQGLTQQDIAGLSARNIRRIESGEVVPRVESLQHFATAHGLPLNDYFNQLTPYLRSV